MFNKNPKTPVTTIAENAIDKWNDFVDTYENEINEANRAVPGVLSDMDAFAAEVFATVHDDNDILSKSNSYHWINRVMATVEDMREFQEAKENHHRNSDESGFFTLGFATAMIQKLCGKKSITIYSDEEKRRYMQEMANKIQDSSDAAIRNATRDAIEDGEEMVEYFNDMNSLGNLCSTEKGIGGDRSNTETLMAADRKLKEKMAMIAKTLGRMKSLAKGAMSKRSDIGKSELFGTKLGGDISNLITPEISKLAIGGAISAEVAGRIVNGNAIQFAFRGKNREGMGPVLVYADGSGSMLESLQDGETREQWAKAIGLTLCLIAKKQKREFKFRQFDGYLHEYGGLDTEFTAQQLTYAMQYFPAGGTSFVQPLQDAEKTLRSAPKFKKADVVMITDGVAYDADRAAKIANSCKQIGARFHLIKMGSFSTPIDNVADQKFTIITGSEREIESVFNSVSKEK